MFSGNIVRDSSLDIFRSQQPERVIEDGMDQRSFPTVPVLVCFLIRLSETILKVNNFFRKDCETEISTIEDCMV